MEEYLSQKNSAQKPKKHEPARSTLPVERCVHMVSLLTASEWNRIWEKIERHIELKERLEKKK
jgi:hypothetical protein